MTNEILQPPSGSESPQYPRGAFETKPEQARLVSIRSRRDKAHPDLLRRLKTALDGRGLVRRKVLCAELGVKDDALRAAARFSNGDVAGSSRGYFLVQQVPPTISNRVVAGLLSRARELKARAAEIIAVINNRDRRAS